MGVWNEWQRILLVMAVLSAGRTLGSRTRSWVGPQREHRRFVLGIRGGGNPAERTAGGGAGEGLEGLDVGRGTSFPPANADLGSKLAEGETEAAALPKEPADRVRAARRGSS